MALKRPPFPPHLPEAPPTNHLPKKHSCSWQVLYAILLSEIGRRYHTFPTGTFQLRFVSPSIPKFILCHFATHLFQWRWTTKSGPNKGKSFPVPTIPTACSKADHHAMQWTVVKSHLSQAALSTEGKVSPELVNLYQNNMLIHFHAQLRVQWLLDGKAPPHDAPLSPPALNHTGGRAPGTALTSAGCWAQHKWRKKSGWGSTLPTIVEPAAATQFDHEELGFEINCGNPASASVVIEQEDDSILLGCLSTNYPAQVATIHWRAVQRHVEIPSASTLYLWVPRKGLRG
ncbi:hypothetical protein EV363DRAFT_1297747 [Boletus edulis]|nr:hypothetical protein EV363DRAFT_1297747 [Boletus edulis]